MKQYEDWTPADYMIQHKKMWNWVADQTIKRKQKVTKDEYFKRKNIKKIYIPENCCYACEVAAMSAIKNNVSHLKMCDYCPINWDTKMLKTKGDRKCVQSIYNEWLTEKNWRRCAELARTIANMPLIKTALH